MKICQITPGLIKVPPDSWGAIEKILWNYKKELEKRGHVLDILPHYYGPEFAESISSKYDIIHCHVANHAERLNNENVKFVFSCHDHHAYWWGKSSPCYKENVNAIKKSILSIVPGEFLINYFDLPYKTFYLPHGVDTKFFVPGREPSEHKLLCVANNGLISDETYDRKGFRAAIELAKKLNLPITIAGPKKNNEAFFLKNRDLLNYKKLEVIYDLPEKDLLSLYQNHTVFLHFSVIEAGHPNLTLLEALSCGLPIIGTYQGTDSLFGALVNEDSQNVELIKKFLEDYPRQRLLAIETSKLFDYGRTAKKLETIYENIINIPVTTPAKFKKSYCDIYSNPTKITRTKRNHKAPVTLNINFIKGAFCEVLSRQKDRFLIEFINQETGKVLYTSTITNNCWSKCSYQFYIDYLINVKNPSNGRILHSYKKELKNRRVYIHLDSESLGDSIAWLPYVEEFRKKHDCIMICSTFHNNLFQKEYPEIEFVKPGSTITDLYAMYEIGLFNNQHKEPEDYKKIPLQKIASNILGLEYKEIKPRLYIRNRGEKEKLVAISTATTCQAKFWNNDGAWQKVIDYLNREGYKVVLLQKESSNLKNVIKANCNDIQDTLNWLSRAEFYIGLSSGVSWLSWAAGLPVVMISGFTKAYNEFSCVRIEPENGICAGCYHDFPWDDKAKGNWYYCPKHENTARQFECTKTITPELVIRKITEAGLIK